MELQIGTDEFSRALYRAQGIVEKKSTMPILASVLLEASEEGRMRVSANSRTVRRIDSCSSEKRNSTPDPPK